MVVGDLYRIFANSLVEIAVAENKIDGFVYPHLELFEMVLQLGGVADVAGNEDRVSFLDRQCLVKGNC
jgi:hypothetical protein